MDEREDGAWSRGVRSPIRWRQIMFLPLDHLGMTSDSTFTDNILFMLRYNPPLDPPKTRIEIVIVCTVVLCGSPRVNGGPLGTGGKRCTDEAS